MPRGGRRRGAGAPKGNLNAFATGEYSEQLARVLVQLLYDPEIARIVAAFNPQGSLEGGVADFIRAAGRVSPSRADRDQSNKSASWESG